MEETWVSEILTFGTALHTEGKWGRGPPSSERGKVVWSWGHCGFCLFWSFLDLLGATTPYGILPCGVSFNPYNYLAQ